MERPKWQGTEDSLQQQPMRTWSPQSNRLQRTESFNNLMDKVGSRSSPVKPSDETAVSAYTLITT